MSDLDLVGLRKIAGKATPGRWVFSPDDGSALDADAVFALDDAGEEVSTVTAWIDANDAAHIAAFDPPTVLALLDLIEELEAELAEYRKREAGNTVERSVRVLEDMSRQAIQRTVGPWMEVDDD